MEQEQSFAMSSNQNQPSGGKYCAEDEKKRKRREKRRLSQAKRRSEEPAAKRQLRQQADREATARNRASETVEETQLRQQADREATARNRASETVEETQLRQQADREATARNRASETVVETQLRQQADREATARNIASETVEETQLRQQADREATARNIASETVEETQLRQQADREATARIRANESFETTTLRQPKCGQYLSDQYNPSNNGDSELIQQFASEYNEGIISPSQRREYGHTLNPDPESDETFKPCGHCGALRFKRIAWCTYAKAETNKGFCCDNGNVKIEIDNPSEVAKDIVNLWKEDSFRGKVLRKYSRQLNTAFALASFCANEVRQSGYNPSYIIKGTTYMRYGDLRPREGRPPSYAQIYLYDPAEDNSRVNIRLGHMHIGDNVTESEKRVLKELLQYFERVLPGCNPYVASFLACKELSEEATGPEMNLTFHDNIVPSGEHSRRYNAPGNAEMCAVASNLEDGNPPLVIRHREETMADGRPKLHIISDTDGRYDRLFFVLLFPDGGNGWHPRMKCVDQETTLTLRKYSVYLLRERPNSTSSIMSAHKLMQQYAVMTFARDEAHKLHYHRKNVSTKRMENLNVLRRNVNANMNTGSNHGQKVTLSSSFCGSVRWYQKKNYEALSIFRRRRKPDLFITMTCNPYHPDILNALPKNCKPEDRPDIVARVFRQHLQQLIQTLINGDVPGWKTAKALIEVIEFQKRGLPHAHILLTLNRDYAITEEEISKYVSAEIPHVETPEDYKVYRNVITKMIHGPCGQHNPNAPCCVNDRKKCSKYYPMHFQSRSYFDQDGKAIYQRRSPEEGGKNAEVKIGNEKVTITNQWVVPYNAYLLKTFNCHINVEIVSSLQVVKYLLWYPFKGDPRVMASVKNSNDEIETYANMRTFGASEVFWRYSDYGMHHRYPTCTSLTVHLENEQVIYFDEGEDMIAMINDPQKVTQLQAYYNMNRDNPTVENVVLKYVDFPEKYVWQQRSKTWTKRRQAASIKSEAIGTLPLLQPNMGDVFYLKLLLTNNHCKGKTSETDLRTVNGTTYNTCKETCMALGLLGNDSEWYKCLDEVEAASTPNSFRNTFAMIVMENHPSDVPQLFRKYRSQLSEDYQHKYWLLTNERLSPEDINSLSLYLMHEKLRNMSDSNNEDVVRKYAMPEINEEQGTRAKQIMEEIESGTNMQRLYAENNIDPEFMEESISNYEKLNYEQKTFCNDALATMLGDTNEQFLASLDAVAGTGKTFTLNVLIAKLWEAGKSVVSAAFSGIAGTLLIGGSTFHSQTNAPFNPCKGMKLGIRKNTEKAKKLINAHAIFLDEGGQFIKWYIEALDELLQDLMENNLPFGGKHLIIGSDFGQTLPIVAKASIAEHFDTCIKNSEFWDKLRKYKLARNERCQDEGWKETLLQVRSGEKESDKDGNIELPENITVCNKDARVLQHELIKFVYSGIQEKYTDHAWLMERCILSPHNDSVNEINEKMTEEMPGEEKIYYSADRVCRQERNDEENVNDFEDVPIDFLNTLNYPGFPRHELRLKKNMILMLMRNINKKEGLCNGTRLILNEAMETTLKCYNPIRNEIVFVPRIELRSDVKKGGFLWTRRQFPVQPAFSMTINKSQGQTIKGKLGIYLYRSVFSHGQLYVALSRSTKQENVKIALTEKGKTANIVYKKALQ